MDGMRAYLYSFFVYVCAGPAIETGEFQAAINENAVR